MSTPSVFGPTGDGPDATGPPTKRPKIEQEKDLNPTQNENIMNPLDDQVQNASGDGDASNGQNSAENRQKSIEKCISALSHAKRCQDVNCSKQSCSK